MSQHGITRALALVAAVVATAATWVGAQEAPLYAVSGNRYVTALLAVDRDDGAAAEIGDTGIVGTRALSCAPDGTLWTAVGETDGSTVHTIDRATGGATLVGASGFPQIDALAVAPEGTIYASVRSDEMGNPGDALATIDPATGAGALVAGNYGGGTAGIVALALSPSGVLYGASNWQDLAEPGLYIIDRVTGLASRIGRLADADGTPLANFLTGMAFATDGTLFGVTENPLSVPAPLRRPRSGVETGAHLVTLDPATARIASVRGTTNYILSDVAACAGVAPGAVFAILPETGGNDGVVATAVYTTLATGAEVSVTLVRSGAPDIPGTAVAVEPVLHRVQASFDLSGAAPGAWDVVVREVANPARVGVLAGGFTVEEARVVVLGIVPASGGDIGDVTVVVRTRYAAADAVARLARGGDEIPARTVRAVPGAPALREPTLVTATFDLTGRPLGDWDVVVENPGAATPPGVLPAGFAIVAGRPPDVALGIVGPARIRTGRDASFLLTLDNRGNTDALGTPILLGVPAGAVWSLDFGRDPFPGQPHQVQEYATPAGPHLFLPAMRLPPGLSRTLALTMRLPSDQVFTLRALWEPLP